MERRKNMSNNKKVQKVVEDKAYSPQDFVAEYNALVKKSGFEIVVSPAFVKRDDGTFSIVLQPTVGRTKK